MPGCIVEDELAMTVALLLQAPDGLEATWKPCPPRSLRPLEGPWRSRPRHRDLVAGLRPRKASLLSLWRPATVGSDSAVGSLRLFDFQARLLTVNNFQASCAFLARAFTGMSGVSPCPIDNQSNKLAKKLKSPKCPFGKVDHAQWGWS